MLVVCRTLPAPRTGTHVAPALFSRPRHAVEFGAAGVGDRSMGPDAEDDHANPSRRAGRSRTRFPTRPDIRATKRVAAQEATPTVAQAAVETQRGVA